MASGNYVAGERFLSYREVMQRWRVSYSTASQAMDQLRAGNMLAVHDRSGHYLTPNFHSDACIALNCLEATPGPAPQRSAHWRTSIMRGHFSGKSLKRIAIAVIMDASVFTELRPFETLLNRCFVTRNIVEAILKSAQAEAVEAFVYEFHSKKVTLDDILAKTLENNPQGVVVRRTNPYRVAPLANALLKRMIPVVTVMGDCENTEMVTVNFNNVGCGYEAAQALMRAGHRNLAVLTERYSRKHLRDRANGFIRTIREHKDCHVTRIAISFKPEENRETAQTLRNCGATAIFCVSEEAFAHFLPSARQAGIRIPQQLGVIVCSSRNNVKQYGKLADITYLDFPAIGHKAFEVLADFHAGITPQRCVLIKTPVISVGSVLPLTQS